MNRRDCEGRVSSLTELLKSRWATGAAMGLGSASGVATVSGPEDGVPGMDRMAIGGAEDRGISGNGSCREGAGGVRMGGTEEREISGNASCREGAGGVTGGMGPSARAGPLAAMIEPLGRG